MRYISLNDKEFHLRYQALVQYIAANQAKTLNEKKNELEGLPDGHYLKFIFFVNKKNGKSFLHKAAAEGNLPLMQLI